MPRNCKYEILSIILCKIAQIWAKLSKVFLCLYFLFLFYNEYSLCRYILGNYNCFTNDFLRSIPHQAKLSKVVQSCAKFGKVVQSCAKLREFVQSFQKNSKLCKVVQHCAICKVVQSCELYFKVVPKCVKEECVAAQKYITVL